MNINKTLSNLNSSHSGITDLVPDLFYFSDEAEASVYGSTYAIAVAEQNGKILVAGNINTQSPGQYTNSVFAGGNGGVLRLNGDGTLDETFDPPYWQNLQDSNEYCAIISMKVQSNGKIIIVGSFGLGYPPQSPGTQGIWVNIARLNADGSLDETFMSFVGGATTRGINGYAYNVGLTSDDGIIMTTEGGNYGSYSAPVLVGKIVKLDANGVLNTEFNDNILASPYDFQITSEFGAGLLVLEDGKILIPAYDSGTDGYILVRLNSDGTEDTSWPSPVGSNNGFYKIVKDGEGRIICSAESMTAGSDAYWGIIRLESDGSVDSSFQYPGPSPIYPVVMLSIQPLEQGKIIAGGFVFGYDGATRRFIQKLNADGSLDDTFSGPYSFDSIVMDIAYLGEDEIWVAGFFGKPRRNIVKLNRFGRPLTAGLPIENPSCGIKDGGNDMYDYGNFINTDANVAFGPTPYSELKEGGLWDFLPFGGSPAESPVSVPSTHTQSYGYYYGSGIEFDPNSPYLYAYKPDVFDGRVKDGSGHFGEGSSYFTSMYPGMFVLAVDNMDIGEFSVTGGASQGFEYPSKSRTVDTDAFTVNQNGKKYSCFLKSMYAAPTGNPYDDPSLNHIIIVPGEPSGITHLYDETSQWDDHCLQGLSGRKELFFLVLSRGNNVPITLEIAQNLVREFLKTTEKNPDEAKDEGKPCFKCKNKSVHDCVKWKYFFPNCLRQNCGGRSGGYVPAVTVCSRRLY